jgi:poly-gamma-glutamate synthesis protein (capsule biosynthesis protein)
MLSRPDTRDNSASSARGAFRPAQTGKVARPIRLIALGQALIAHDVRARAYPGYEALRARLRGADVVLSDLETALHTGQAADPTRQGVFLHCAEPEVLDCLRALSINLLALANNHSFDLGAAGVAAAIAETRRRGCGHAGTGATLAHASVPGYLETDAGRVALVAFASKVPPGSEADANHAGVNPLRLASDGTLVAADRARILAAITEAAAEAQLVVACHHDHYWAPDWRETPAWKRLFARACIDAGAHTDVSHGVARQHGNELPRERPIF